MTRRLAASYTTGALAALPGVRDNRSGVPSRFLNENPELEIVARLGLKRTTFQSRLRKMKASRDSFIDRKRRDAPLLRYSAAAAALRNSCGWPVAASTADQTSPPG